MTSIVRTSTINIPENRIRREFKSDAIDALADSILGVGLLHPPVVNGNKLVAGERRYRAILRIYEQGKTFYHNGSAVPRDSLPVTQLSDLDPIAVREAELEENTIRQDLTVIEKADAVAQLHTLRAEQRPTQTMKDTVEEITGSRGSSTDLVRDSLLVSQHADDPEVQRAKSLREASRIVRKKMEREFSSALTSFNTLDSEHEFIFENTKEALPRFADSSFAVILTDPPYGMGADTFGDQAQSIHDYDDSFEEFERLATFCSSEFYRITEDQAHLYIFCTLEGFDIWEAFLNQAGFTVWPRPMIWYKGNNGMLPQPELGPRYTYECILYANKGKRVVNNTGAHDVITVTSSSDSQHAARKPVELYTELLSRSVLPGDRVLDPFAGGGPIFPAAHAHSCKATGIDQDKASRDMCMARIGELK